MAYHKVAQRRRNKTQPLAALHAPLLVNVAQARVVLHVTGMCVKMVEVNMHEGT